MMVMMLIVVVSGGILTKSRVLMVPNRKLAKNKASCVVKTSSMCTCTYMYMYMYCMIVL